MYCSFVRQLSVLYNIGLTIYAPYCETLLHTVVGHRVRVCEEKALQLTHSLTIDLYFTAHAYLFLLVLSL